MMATQLFIMKTYGVFNYSFYSLSGIKDELNIENVGR